MNSNYYDIDQIQTLKFPEKNNSLSLLHVNTCWLSKNFDDLEHLLKCANKVFDIVAEICYLYYLKKQNKLLQSIFKAGMSNIKNTWKGIKSIIIIKNLFFKDFVFQWFHHHKPNRNF